MEWHPAYRTVLDVGGCGFWVWVDILIGHSALAGRVICICICQLHIRHDLVYHTVMPNHCKVPRTSNRQKIIYPFGNRERSDPSLKDNQPKLYLRPQAGSKHLPAGTMPVIYGMQMLPASVRISQAIDMPS